MRAATRSSRSAATASGSGTRCSAAVSPSPTLTPRSAGAQPGERGLVGDVVADEEHASAPDALAQPVQRAALARWSTVRSSTSLPGVVCTPGRLAGPARTAPSPARRRRARRCAGAPRRRSACPPASRRVRRRSAPQLRLSRPSRARPRRRASSRRRGRRRTRRRGCRPGATGAVGPGHVARSASARPETTRDHGAGERGQRPQRRHRLRQRPGVAGSSTIGASMPSKSVRHQQPWVALGDRARDVVEGRSSRRRVGRRVGMPSAARKRRAQRSTSWVSTWRRSDRIRRRRLDRAAWSARRAARP